MSCTLYILQSQVKETYYTGISDDADTRSIYHNAENKGYTRRYRPWNGLVFLRLGYQLKSTAKYRNRYAGNTC